MDRERLGELIELARDESGLTVEQLAGQIGCTSGTLRRYEKGRNMPPFDTAVALARALQKPLSYFTENPDDAGTFITIGDGAGIPVRDPMLADILRNSQESVEVNRINRGVLREVRRMVYALSSDVAELLDTQEETAKRTARAQSSRQATPTHEGKAAAG